jgi:TRAP-type transport system periplasmic protein
VGAIRIRCGGYQPPRSVHTRAIERFGRGLVERLGSGVAFEFDADVVSRGEKAADLLEWTRTGRIELCYFSTSYLARDVPGFGVLDLPFLIERRERAYSVLDGDFGAQLSLELSAKRGLTVLGYFDNGFRHWSNRVRIIRSPEDCRGLRLRTLLSDAHSQVFRDLGFVPVPLDVGDLLAAVRSGAVDAQENPLTNTYNFGIYEHHRYITLSAHLWGSAALLCNSAAFAGWPSEIRKAVAVCAQEATADQRRMASADDEDASVKLRAAGCTLTELTAGNRAAFVRALAPVVERQCAGLDPKAVGALGSESTPSAPVADHGAHAPNILPREKKKPGA